MDEKTQAEFIQWLAEQLGVNSEEDLQKQLTNMGDEGVKQAFEAFQQEKQRPTYGLGGKIAYLSRLKKGGKITTGEKADSKTAVKDMSCSGEDKANALGGRKEAGDPKLTALKKLKDKASKFGKTAVGITKQTKGKDGATALGGRKDSGKDEHTAVNKHQYGGKVGQPITYGKAVGTYGTASYKPAPTMSGDEYNQLNKAMGLQNMSEASRPSHINENLSFVNNFLNKLRNSSSKTVNYMAMPAQAEQGDGSVAQGMSGGVGVYEPKTNKWNYAAPTANNSNYGWSSTPTGVNLTKNK